MSAQAWPAINATLNATSAVLLLTGLGFIKQQRVTAHLVVMLAAFAVSIGFLGSYLAYHTQVGSVHFPGQGWIRPLYFTILISHTILAIVIVPLALRTLYLAARRRYEAHTRIARVTWPLWLYVSVTGVVVYWLLYRSPWGVRG